jgi:hypothetical protein
MIVTVDIGNGAQHNPNDCAQQQAAKNPSKLSTGHVSILSWRTLSFKHYP